MLRIKKPVIVLTAFLILQNFVPITFLQVSPAHAALDIPNVVNYQATLQNSSGEYVTAPTDMKFVIYDASSGGNCLWTATGTCASPTAVSIDPSVEGRFTVLLGDTAGTPAFNPLPEDLFTSGGDRYLGVTIATDLEMTPRKRLSSVPWAYNTARLEGLQALDSGSTDSYIVAGDENGNIVLTGDPQGGGVDQGVLYINPSGGQVDSGDTLLGLAVDGAEVFTVNEAGDTNIEGDLTVGAGATVSLFVDSQTGLVGLGGNVSPAAGLTVGTGSVDFASGADSVYIANDLEVDGTIYGQFSGTINPNLTEGSVIFQGAGGLSEDNANFFWDSGNARLGLGTASPEYLLDLADTMQIGDATDTEQDLIVFNNGKAIGSRPTIGWEKDIFYNILEGIKMNNPDGPMTLLINSEDSYSATIANSQNNDSEVEIMVSHNSDPSTSVNLYAHVMGLSPTTHNPYLGYRRDTEIQTYLEAITSASGIDEVVFNQGGFNTDFRVESDNLENMFFIDAETDTVAVGTATTSASFSFQVEGASSLNGDVDFNNNEAKQFRVENVAGSLVGAPACSALTQGRQYYDTDDDNAYVCVESSPGVYSWFNLTQTFTSTSTKVVTAGTGADYSTIGAAAGYLNTLTGGIIILTPETHTVSNLVDLTNITLIGSNIQDTVINITGSGRMDIKETQFKYLTIQVSSGITANSGLDAKYEVTTNSSATFESVDFNIGAGKYLIDSSEASEPTVNLVFTNSSAASNGAGIVPAQASDNLSDSSTVYVTAQGRTGELDFNDWDIDISGFANVYTTGTLTNIPNDTIYIYPGMNLQGAVDSLPNGGIIKLLPGIHNITDTLLLDNDSIELSGYGDSSILRAAGFASQGQTDAAIQIGVADGSAPVNDVIVKDFKLEVDNINVHGIRAVGGEDIIVTNMTVEKTNGASGSGTAARVAIQMLDGTAEPLVRPVVKDCRIIGDQAGSDYFTDGIHITGGIGFGFAGVWMNNGGGIKNALIDGNNVDVVRETTAVFIGVSDSSMYNNRFSHMGAGGAASYGIFMGNSQRVNMTANVISGSLSINSYGIVIETINPGSYVEFSDSVVNSNVIDGTANGGVGFAIALQLGSDSTNTGINRNIFTANIIRGASTATTTTAIDLQGQAEYNHFVNNTITGDGNTWDVGINLDDAGALDNDVAGTKTDNVTLPIDDNGTDTKFGVEQHRATTGPGSSDDINAGYQVGQLWINTNTDQIFVNVDNSSGAADWDELAVSAGSVELDDVYDNDTDKIMTIDDATGLEFESTSAGNIVFDLRSSGALQIHDLGTPFATFGADGTVDFANDFSVDTNTLFIDSTNNNVGIGTDTPNTSAELEIVGDMMLDDYIYFNNNTAEYFHHDGATFVVSDDLLPSVGSLDLGSSATRWAELYLGADGIHLGVATDDFDITYSAGDNGLRFQNADNDSITAYQFLDADGGNPILNIDTINERIGVGTATPEEAMHIMGGLVIGNTLGSTAGTLRWTGSDFEGYDGSEWVSFTRSDVFDAFDAAGGIDITAGWTDITLDTEVKEDPSFSHAEDSAEITINSTGSYEVTYSITTEIINTDTNRTDSLARMVEDTGSGYTEIPGTRGGMYNRANNRDLANASLTFVRDFNAGNIIKLQATVDSGDSDVGTTPNSTRVVIKKISSSGTNSLWYSSSDDAYRSGGNVNIGTSENSTGDNLLVIADSSAPTASVTDGIQLFAVESAGSHELRVRDEAGNITTLSPHNFSLIPEGPEEALSWAYYSEYNGKAINVDMTKAMRLLEKISGEKLVFSQDLSTGEELTPQDLKLPGFESENQDAEEESENFLLTQNEYMTINEAGNVGIGVEDPQYLLEVGGTAGANAFVQILSEGDIQKYIDFSEADWLERLDLSENAEDLEFITEDGRGVDIFRMSNFLLEAIKSQEVRIENLTSDYDEFDAIIQEKLADVIIDTLVVKNTARFEAEVELEKHIVFANDSMGQARIKPGDSEVKVEFSEQYESMPIVTLTLASQADFDYYFVDEVSTAGFTVKVEGDKKKRDQNIVFNWHAFVVDEGKSTLSDGTLEDLILLGKKEDNEDAEVEAMDDSEENSEDESAEASVNSESMPEETDDQNENNDSGTEENSTSEESENSQSEQEEAEAMDDSEENSEDESAEASVNSESMPEETDDQNENNDSGTEENPSSEESESSQSEAEETDDEAENFEDESAEVSANTESMPEETADQDDNSNSGAEENPSSEETENSSGEPAETEATDDSTEESATGSESGSEQSDSGSETGESSNDGGETTQE